MSHSPALYNSKFHRDYILCNITSSPSTYQALQGGGGGGGGGGLKKSLPHTLASCPPPIPVGGVAVVTNDHMTGA